MIRKLIVSALYALSVLSAYKLGLYSARLDVLMSANLTDKEALKCAREIKK